MARWDPWRELSRLQDEFTKAYGRTFGAPGAAAFWTPEIDMYEKNNNIIVKADLPNIKIEDVEVSITENLLTIKGERKGMEEVKEENYYRMERQFGSFERTIELPVGVRSEQVEAAYKDGVLTITLPKAEEKKGREVKITAA